MSTNYSNSSSSTSQGSPVSAWATYPVLNGASSWTYSGAKVPSWAVNAPGPPSAHLPPTSGPPSDTKSPVVAPVNRSSGPPVVIPAAAVAAKGRKRKQRTAEEHALIKDSATKLASLLASDTKATTQPDVETPFSDAADVVKRLLPWHIWQHPTEDIHSLAWPANGKGKKRATEKELVEAELAETRFAMRCEDRKRNLASSIRRISCMEGTRNTLDEIGYALSLSVLESERTDVSQLTIELRNARTSWDRFQREQRIQQAGNPTPTQPQPTASTLSQTSSAHNHVDTSFAGYYRGTATSLPTTSQSTPTPVSVTTTQPFPYFAAASRLPPSTPRNSTPTSSIPTIPSATVNTAASAPVPVQLPITALGVLKKLGIIPVPVTQLQAGQSRPQCVLTGTQQNGTLLSLEINVGSLQSVQVNGLAMLLGSLMKDMNGTMNPATGLVNGSSNPGSSESQSQS